MTLEELRKLRDEVADLKIQFFNTAPGSELEVTLRTEYGKAWRAFNEASFLYVNNLLDSMPASDAVVRLWEAANEYHMVRGGGVLSFEAFRDLIAKPPDAKS